MGIMKQVIKHYHIVLLPLVAMVVGSILAKYSYDLWIIGLLILLSYPVIVGTVYILSGDDSDVIVIEDT